MPSPVSASSHDEGNLNGGSGSFRIRETPAFAQTCWIFPRDTVTKPYPKMAMRGNRGLRLSGQKMVGTIASRTESKVSTPPRQINRRDGGTDGRESIGRVTSAEDPTQTTQAGSVPCYGNTTIGPSTLSQDDFSAVFENQLGQRHPVQA